MARRAPFGIEFANPSRFLQLNCQSPRDAAHLIHQANAWLLLSIAKGDAQETTARVFAHWKFGYKPNLWVAKVPVLVSTWAHIEREGPKNWKTKAKLWIMRGAIFNFTPINA